MKHKVVNVEDLYRDSEELLRNVNGGLDNGADTIIKNLTAAIENLTANWEGADAGVQIQKIVVAHNAMVDISNALGNLSVDSSKVAINYRNVQIANEANLPHFNNLSYNPCQHKPDYSDNRDTININPDANTGKARLDAAYTEINEFITTINRLYNKIMDNWLIGTGRDSAQEALNSNTYRSSLDEVSKNITSALENYTF